MGLQMNAEILLVLNFTANPTGHQFFELLEMVIYQMIFHSRFDSRDIGTVVTFEIVNSHMAR